MSFRERGEREREKERERERERREEKRREEKRREEKNNDWLLPICAPTRDQTCSLGMCPAPELNS